MFEKLYSLICKYDRIIIHRHTNPDGDALGSQLGLLELLRASFPTKEVYAVGDSSKRYRFMEGSDLSELSDLKYEGALAIVLDTATPELVSDMRFAKAKATARIDHHIYCQTFTDWEIVDTSFESCSGMIAAFAKECSLTLTDKAAKLIYTGMVTDSGRFRYDSTSAKTFELASFLMSKHIDTAEIYRNLYSDDLKSVKNRAYFMSKITMYKDSTVAYLYTNKDELATLDMTVFSASRGMVNVMSDIKGIDIWVNFTEADNIIECELRSSKYNINPVAVKYGGGGHEKASGASVKDKAEVFSMLDDLVKLTETAK